MKPNQDLGEETRKYLLDRPSVEKSELCVHPYIQCAQITNAEKQICAKTCDEIRECDDGIDESYEHHNCSIRFTFSNVTVTESETSISSPNFPNNYFSDARKIWFIHVEDGFLLKFKIEQYQLESNCKDDVILVKDIVRDNEVKSWFSSSYVWLGRLDLIYINLCNVPDPVSYGWATYAFNITVIFISDSSTTDRGFRALVKKIRDPDHNVVKRSVDSFPSPTPKHNTTREAQTLATTTDNNNGYTFPTLWSTSSGPTSIHESKRLSETTLSTTRSTTQSSTTGARITTTLTGKPSTISTTASTSTTSLSTLTNTSTTTLLLTEEQTTTTTTPPTTEALLFKEVSNPSMDEAFEDIFANFTDNYFELYDKTNREDYSDVRQAVFFDQEFVQLTGHQRNDFIVQCSFDNKNCKEQAFSEFEDPMYGKCFTFYPW
ncbi:uncharacterized protein LOC142356314, partial [Convolutriloba macropyga]|uniref:uncharacterized protein LOC142356314 n=1 Tax=Convolutriloba macropyga TaxID=536237 RepID=UPI003F51BE7C